MSAAWSIRLMKPADYAVVMGLWTRTEGMGMSAADSEEGIHRFLERNPGLSFVAESGGEIVGAALGGTDGRRGFIYHLAVEKAHRRSGIGAALVEACVAALRREGIQKCHVVVYKDNAEGRRFWERCGWELRDNLVIMSKLPN